MRKTMIVAILAVSVLISSGCVGQGYEGTLRYQEAGDFQCETYYLVINNEGYMLNTSVVGGLEGHIGKKVRVRGEVVEGPGLRQCQFKHAIDAVEVQILE